MAHHRGPKTVTEDLIFNYDTGNEKSFAGEPTTNLSNFNIANNTFSSDTPLNITQTANSSEETFQGRLSRKVVINAGGFWNSYVYSYNTSVNSPIFTVSFKIKMSDGSNPNTIITGGYIYGSAGSFYPGPTFTYLFDGWYLGTLLYNGTSMTLTSITGFYGEGGPKTFYVADWQVEAKSHSTPFVNGTRSTTQSLLDLSKKSVMTVANASFDSNAMLNFDGTNDYIQLTTFPQPTNYITCEAWINPQNTVTTGGIRGGAISSSNSMYLGIIDSTDGGVTNSMHWAVSTSTGARPYNINGQIPRNQWTHLVGTYNGSISRAYLNGIEIWSASLTGTIPSATYYIGTYGQSLTDGVHNFNGYIPVAKIYNRALTAEQVLQNFNASKRRFGL